MTTTITRVRPDDRAHWEELWRAYLAFYETTLSPAQYDFTWARLGDGRMHGLAARDAAHRMVGLTHYLFHEHGWTLGPACYLQDLFVDPRVRGGGIGRSLIEAVATDARARGASRLYWLTHADNVAARGLYDRLARHEGFLVYRFPL